MANRTKLTLSARETFLGHLRAGNTITFAADAIGMRRQGLYEHRDNEPAFAAEWDRALEEGIDVLEQEAKRRAVEGTLKPVYHQGMEVGHVREFSDALLTLLLKAKKPTVYRENVSVEQKGRVHHEHSGRVNLRLASEDELAVLERLAAKVHTNGVAK